MVREAGPAVSTGTGVFRKRKNQRCKVFVVLGDDAAVIRVVKWQKVLAVLGDDAAVIRVVNGRLKVLAVFGDDAL
ncbi:unnamed protein product [Sphagnum jensenii]